MVMGSMSSVSAQLAHKVASVSFEALTAQEVCAVKRAILDYIGVLLAGQGEESVLIVRQTVEVMGGNPQASIWGCADRVPVALAAIANGTAAHALDYDDTNIDMVAHPSIQLLPGLFALAEWKGRTGAEIITAYLSGYEVGLYLGAILNPAHIAQGWLPVGTIGPLMQAAACAKLLGSSPQQIQMAIGLAVNMASGLRCNNGSMAKPLLAGQACANGVWASLLAQRGMTAHPRIIEDRYGYMSIFTSRNALPDEDDFGRKFNRNGILSSGLSAKLYPCCAAAHVAVDCALEISRDALFVSDAIEHIEIKLHASIKRALVHPCPKNAAEARFSLPYCVCRALLDKQLGLDQFRQDKIDDPTVRALMEKIRPIWNEEPLLPEDIAGNRFPVEMHVRLANSTMLVFRAEYAKGTPANPLTDDDLERKFQQCCKGRLSEKDAAAIIEQVMQFETLTSLEPLIALLTVPAASVAP